ncbi:Lipoxygenase y domain-containing protein 1 [Liparis tanakae]|uniref:Lipoxygenase y domain-containing protein 1 n=1 Tax=Liparis tanakae TaxID=230148 RepID=A0A4Z2FR16_9TELE|nr:Lipoxygenase y domain-containing protein 1 [Liparis tanakae]
MRKTQTGAGGGPAGSSCVSVGSVGSPGRANLRGAEFCQGGSGSGAPQHVPAAVHLSALAPKHTQLSPHLMLQRSQMYVRDDDGPTASAETERPMVLLTQTGNADKFDFSSKNLGDIAGICLGHTPKDGKKVKGEVFWKVEEVVVTERELGNRYIFTCNALLPLSPKRDDFLTVECSKAIESFASKARSLVPVKYEIIVVTGDEKGAGTDANGFITIYGSNGDSGQRPLRQKFRNLFEREQTDRFLLEMLDMGELQKVRVEHDNAGMNPSWLLDRVEVTNTANGVTTIFLCGKWLDTKRADGLIARVLYPKY